MTILNKTLDLCPTSRSSSTDTSSDREGSLDYQQGFEASAMISSVGNGSTASTSPASAVGTCTDRYITPEYLAPLPSSDKNGKSPLQMLAQTCSQIGADSPGSSKLLAEKMNGGSIPAGPLPLRAPSISPINAHKPSSGVSSDNNNSLKRKSVSPALIVSDIKQRATHSTSPPANTGSSRASSVNFKPYESSEKKSKSSVISLSPPPPLAPIPFSSSSSPTATARLSSDGTSGVSHARRKSSPTSTPSNPKDLLAKHEAVMSHFAGHHNPAFRPPFGASTLSAYSHGGSSLAASLAAAAASTAAGGLTVCRDPYCRDPTCPTAAYNAHMASITPTSLLANATAAQYSSTAAASELLKAQQQMAAAAMAAMHHASSAAATTTASPSMSTTAALTASKDSPYICNWMNGRDGYCGKRHSTAEELLQHLRTHTNLTTNDSAAAAAAAMMASSAYQFPGSATAGGSSLLQRSATSYGSLAAASSRYHPYGGKPGSSTGHLPPSLTGLAGLSATASSNPLSLSGMSALAGLGAAYNPLYALYGSRLNGTSSLLP